MIRQTVTCNLNGEILIFDGNGVGFTSVNIAYDSVRKNTCINIPIEIFDAMVVARNAMKTEVVVGAPKKEETTASISVKTSSIAAKEAVTKEEKPAKGKSK